MPESHRNIIETVVQKADTELGKVIITQEADGIRHRMIPDLSGNLVVGEIHTRTAYFVPNNGDLTQGEEIHLIGNNWITDLTISHDTVFIRPHSACRFSEVFGFKDCDCAHQLNASLDFTMANPDLPIATFYLDQEGRGHGIFKKMQILAEMQRNNVDTYQACANLGLEADIRQYNQTAAILAAYGVKNVILMSNNPLKIQRVGESLSVVGIELIATYGLEVTPSPESHDYLVSKALKGHDFPASYGI